MSGLDMNEIHKLYHEQTAVITEHTKHRCSSRGISIAEVEEAILSGEIIEQYPNDYPYPSCLLLGWAAEKAVHVVVGVGDGRVWVITAYYPDKERWSKDFKARKEKEK